jgi:hypothetical protein
MIYTDFKHIPRISLQISFIQITIKSDTISCLESVINNPRIPCN